MAVPHDDRQRIVQLVRHAGQEVAHRRELFRSQELLRALADLRLEALVLAPELLVEEARLEQVPDAKEDLRPIERLRHEIVRAGRERAMPALERHVRGQHEDGRAGLGSGLRLQLLEHLDAVDIGHPEIQQDQIRPELRAALRHLARVRRASQHRIAGILEHLLQQAHIGPLVVDDQDLGQAECRRKRGAHGAGSSVSRSASSWRTSSGFVR